MRVLDHSRLARTFFQFGRLRLQIASVTGLALVIIAIAVDPQSNAGVILVSLGTGVLTSTIVAAIALEREEFLHTVLGLGVQEIFDDRAKAFDNEFWNALVDSTRYRYRVLGVANHGYLRNQTIRDQTTEAFLEATRRGVDVEVLWLNPEHMLATIREEEEGVRGTRDDTINSIIFFWELHEQLADDEKPRLSLREHTAMPTCGITWSDDFVMVTHYLAQKLNLGSPGLVLGPSMSLLDRLVLRLRRRQPVHPKITEAYMSNYREIAESSTEITSERVEQLRSLLGSWGPEAQQRKSESEIRAEAETDGSSREEHDGK